VAEAETEIQLPPARAAELIEAGADLVDVRMDYEWDGGRIAGARHVEMNDLPARADSLPRDRPVLFYCRTGSRSAVVVEAFRQAGYDAYDLAGGLAAWVEDGLPIEPPDGVVEPTRPA
jgi:rhodanese-related sulfurtransferase